MEIAIKMTRKKTSNNTTATVSALRNYSYTKGHLGAIKFKKKVRMRRTLTCAHFGIDPFILACIHDKLPQDRLFFLRTEAILLKFLKDTEYVNFFIGKRFEQLTRRMDASILGRKSWFFRR